MLLRSADMQNSLLNRTAWFLPTREDSNGKNQNVKCQAYRHFYLAAPFLCVPCFLVQHAACGLEGRFIRSQGTFIFVRVIVCCVNLDRLQSLHEDFTASMAVEGELFYAFRVGKRLCKVPPICRQVMP